MYSMFKNRALLTMLLSSLFLGMKVVAAAESVEPKDKEPITSSFDEKIQQFDEVLKSTNLENISQWLKSEKQSLSEQDSYARAMITHVAKIRDDELAAQVLRSVLEYSNMKLKFSPEKDAKALFTGKNNEKLDGF